MTKREGASLVAPISSLSLRLRVIPINARVDRSGKQLTWKSSGSPFACDVPADFLTHFCVLADPEVAPQRIADFAREWGSLGELAVRVGHLTGPPPRSEPIARWRSIARTAAAIGRLLVATRGESPQCWKENAFDWREATTLERDPWISGTPPWHPEPDGLPVVDRRLALPERRQFLGEVLHDFFGLARPLFEADLVELRRPFAGMTVYGPVGAAAGVLTQFAASNAGRLMACCRPGCALPFVGSQPIPTRHSFCVAHRDDSLRAQWDVRGKPKRVSDQVGGDRHA